MMLSVPVAVAAFWDWLLIVASFTSTGCCFSFWGHGLMLLLSQVINCFRRCHRQLIFSFEYYYLSSCVAGPGQCTVAHTAVTAVSTGFCWCCMRQPFYCCHFASAVFFCHFIVTISCCFFSSGCCCICWRQWFSLLSLSPLLTASCCCCCCHHHHPAWNFRDVFTWVKLSPITALFSLLVPPPVLTAEAVAIAAVPQLLSSKPKPPVARRCSRFQCLPMWQCCVVQPCCLWCSVTVESWLSLAACCLSFAIIVAVVDDGNNYHHCHGRFIVVIEQTAKLSKMKNHVEISYNR